jgi:EmrB/QacA subfamily drug resistance transporter
LPTLREELNTTFAAVQWVVLAYLLTLATLLLSVGRAADIIGKKRIYVAGFVVFTVGSVLCGLSPTVEWLIAMRVVQGIGAAMLFSLGPAILTEAFPPSERGRALGISGAVVSIGVIAGPTLGGLILGSLSWHWIFFVNLPVGIVGTWLALRSIPVTMPRGGQTFDFVGAGTLFVGLLTFLLALTLGQERGFGSPSILALFGVALIAAALFLWIELRVSQPMVDLRLFRNGLFSANLAMSLITFVGLAGVTLLLPFYLQGMRGFPVGQVGLLLAVLPIALGIASPISGSLSDRYGPRLISLVGLALLVVGYLGLSTLGLSTPLWLYALLVTPVGLGMGIFQSPNNSAVLGSVPRDRLGVVSGLLALTRNLGQTTGFAIFGALWAAGVVGVLGVLPPGGAPDAPPEAQIAGLQTAYLVGAGFVSIALALAIWSWYSDRRDRAAHPQSVMGAPE